MTDFNCWQSPPAYLLVVKTHQPGHHAALHRRTPVIPHNILVQLPVNFNRIVLRLALVRTPRARLARSKHRRVDGGEGDVIPTRQAGLVEMHRTAGIGHHLPVDEHPDMSRRLQDIHALERVLGVDVHRRVLLEPLVHAGEIDLHEPSQLRGGAGEVVGEGEDVVGGFLANAEGELLGEGWAVGGRSKGLALDDLEGSLFRAFEQAGLGDVELGIERVFPDETGLRGLEDVEPVVENFHHAWRWEDFGRSVRSEFEGEFLEAGGGDVSMDIAIRFIV